MEKRGIGGHSRWFHKDIPVKYEELPDTVSPATLPLQHTNSVSSTPEIGSLAQQVSPQEVIEESPETEIDKEVKNIESNEAQEQLNKLRAAKVKYYIAVFEKKTKDINNADITEEESDYDESPDLPDNTPDKAEDDEDSAITKSIWSKVAPYVADVISNLKPAVPAAPVLPEGW